MLTKLRKKLGKNIEKIGYLIALFLPSPNIITLLGLLFAVIFFITVLLKNIGYIYALIFYLFSITMDVIDGAVARATKKSSKLGSFLDSITDRVADTIYIMALHYMLNLQSIITLLLIFGCLMISYTRAKAESLGLKMEGIGIAERGDRLIIIFIILLVYIINIKWAYYLTLALLLLILITIIQRIRHVLIKLSAITVKNI
ncbi:MAG TPA: CDP-alcohol phosphatidyltransferase family protein [Thermoprotei archaeon]|nr:CDP-alcohol phosphatidyltransferase family protein [Thermoprotei archaeon]